MLAQKMCESGQKHTHAHTERTITPLLEMFVPIVMRQSAKPFSTFDPLKPITLFLQPLLTDYGLTVLI